MTKNNDEKNSCYEISEDLLELLQEEHPDSLPSFEPSAWELGKMVGAKEVIDKIILLTKSAEIEKIMEDIDNV